MAIGNVRTPGLNGHGTGPTPQYSFFGACAAMRIVQSYNLRWIRLIYVEKAAQVNTANMQAADANRGIRQWIEFERQTRLHAVRIFVVLIEAHDHGGTEESAPCQRPPRARKRNRVRIGALCKKLIQRGSGNERPARECEELCLGV